MQQHICKHLFLKLGDGYIGILLLLIFNNIIILIYNYLYFCISKIFCLKLCTKS